MELLMIVVVYFLYRVIIRQDALVQNQKEIIKSIEKLESNEIKT